MSKNKKANSSLDILMSSVLSQKNIIWVSPVELIMNIVS